MMDKAPKRPIGKKTDARKTEEIIEALLFLSIDKISVVEFAFFGGQRRIDFWTLQPIKSKGFEAISYEIKVSRSDFKNDDKEKQSGALEYSDRFFYVTPEGLIDKGEIPEWAGLKEWNGSELKTIKRAPKREKNDPDWLLFVSAIRNSVGCRRDTNLMRDENAIYKRLYERERERNEALTNMYWKRQQEIWELTERNQ